MLIRASCFGYHSKGCQSETPFSTLLGVFPLSIKHANKQGCNANLPSSFQEQEANYNETIDPESVDQV